LLRKDRGEATCAKYSFQVGVDFEFNFPHCLLYNPFLYTHSLISSYLFSGLGCCNTLR
jgi:hypothetical protein